MNNPRSNSK